MLIIFITEHNDFMYLWPTSMKLFLIWNVKQLSSFTGDSVICLEQTFE